MKFTELARCPEKVTSTVGFMLTPELYLELGKFVNKGVRLTFRNGILTYDRTEGSYQYPEELQIHVYTYDVPEVAERAYNNGVSRIEIPTRISKGQQMLKEALDSLDQNVAKFM